MELYEVILEIAEKKLEEVAMEGRFKNAEDLHCVYELMGIANRAYKVMCMDGGEEESEGGLFSRNSYENRGASGGSYRNSYEGGSYRRDGSRRSMRGGSYRNSRQDEKDFTKKMQEMREYAPDEQTKMEIDRLLAQMGK